MMNIFQMCNSTLELQQAYSHVIRLLESEEDYIWWTHQYNERIEQLQEIQNSGFSPSSD